MKNFYSNLAYTSRPLSLGEGVGGEAPSNLVPSLKERGWGEAILCALLLCSTSLHAQKNDLKVALLQRPSTASVNKFYVSNKTPLKPLYFIKLPVGTIKPQGWILKYLELQRDGLTGKLGEISAWLDKKNNAWFSGNGQGDHGWEEVPYWLKGCGDLGYILKDQKIIDETKLGLEKVVQSQRPDGFFGPVDCEQNTTT